MRHSEGRAGQGRGQEMAEERRAGEVRAREGGEGRAVVVVSVV